MMNPLVFQADARNCGGRSEIERIMMNHRSKVINAKPVVKIKAPRPHIKDISPSRRDSEGNLYVYRIASSVFFFPGQKKNA